jgi:hypothetical protein
VTYLLEEVRLVHILLLQLLQLLQLLLAWVLRELIDNLLDFSDNDGGDKRCDCA